MAYASKIVLTPFAGAVIDQGSIGSCVENTLVSNVDLIMRQAGHAEAPFSRLQSYADTREAMGSFSYDSGSIPNVTFNQAMTKGLAYESSWGYSTDNLYNHPTTAVYTEAAEHKLDGYQSLNMYQNQGALRDMIKSSLLEGKPVMIEFKVRDFFMYEYGPLSTQVNSGWGSIVGVHETLIVGTDDSINGGSYIVKNSWGTGWGDGGYGTLKYTQLGPDFSTSSTDLLELDVITGFDGLNFNYTADRVTMSQEFAGLLHRAGDIAGVDWWSSLLHNGMSTAQVADYLITSTEGAALYATDTNTQFVDELYQNIFGRTADSSGEAFWSGLITNGTSRGTVADYLLHSTEATTGDYFINKTSLSSYISIAMQYQGNHQTEVATAIGSVTTDPNYIEVIKIGLADVFLGA